MNERFLFRGKAAQDWKTPICKKGSWITGCINRTGDFINDPNGQNLKYYIGTIPLNHITIGQCTGLRDKTGKLIFEGDILKFQLGGKSSRPFQMAVTWYVTVASFCVGDADNGYFLDVLKDIEIIGNIHDNPDILVTAVDKHTGG